MENNLDRSYFFDDGIQFECTQCGHCCQGAPGIVRASWGELDAIAGSLSVTIKHLLDKGIAEPYEAAYRLHEDPKDGRCVFFENNGCRVYDARPLQCRTWPFWFNNLRSEACWRAVAKECPGIGRGRLYTKQEILELLSL